MELKEFVKETLIAIQEGVAEAVTHYRQSGGVGRISAAIKDGDDVDWSQQIRPVEFDVAVRSAGKIEGSGKAGGKLFIAEIGGDVNAMKETSHTNRVKFTVPVILPLDVVEGRQSNFPPGPSGIKAPVYQFRKLVTRRMWITRRAGINRASRSHGSQPSDGKGSRD